jgi:hypothetical protein
MNISNKEKLNASNEATTICPDINFNLNNFSLDPSDKIYKLKVEKDLLHLKNNVSDLTYDWYNHIFNSIINN